VSRFSGQFHHAIDEKGRIIFPSKFREIFAQEHDGHMVITKGDGCLRVFPFNEWLILEEKIITSIHFTQGSPSVSAVFMSGAVDCNLDAQGRVLIPLRYANMPISKKILFWPV